MSFLRRRKTVANSTSRGSDRGDDEEEKKKNEKKGENIKKGKNVEGKKIEKWSCIDSCCWFIGFICSVWWFLLFLYNAMPASFPQYVTEAITGPWLDPPGAKLRKEGLSANHPVVFVPGIVTGGLELWEGRQCADGLFRKRLWGGTFGELYKRYTFLVSTFMGLKVLTTLTLTYSLSQLVSYWGKFVQVSLLYMGLIPKMVGFT